jgi:uncharacterized membrane protein SirB2
VLFEYRFFLKILQKPVAKSLKVIPHINDTLLLFAGISLAFMGGINPLHHAWLMAKIIALVFYIIFGTVALKSVGMKSITAYILATATFIFIVYTAVTKTPFFINL